MGFGNLLSVLGGPVVRYTRWLHTGNPAGVAEKLPETREGGLTAVAGVRVVGDLTGIPLLKFSIESGVQAVRGILAEPGFRKGGSADDVLDLAVVGGGLSGIAAAVEAKKAGLQFEVYEASKPFSTIVDFPKGKPIYTYPAEMTPVGDLQVSADVKEDLVAELEQQREQAGIEPIERRIERIEKTRDGLILHYPGGTTKARRVIVAIGRSGNFRKLGVPGEDLDKVYHRLHDPQDLAGKCVLVVGGGDSALESAIALALAGASVTLSYRKDSFARPKPENEEKLRRLVADPGADVGIEQPSSDMVTTAFTPAMCSPERAGSIQLAMATTVEEIRERTVVLKDKDGQAEELPNQAVFRMIGREAPLDFFRRSGIPIIGEWRAGRYLAFGAFMAFCVFLYHWKKDFRELPIQAWFRDRGWFPYNIGELFASLGQWVSTAAQTETSFLYTLRTSMSDGGFYYTLAYCLCVVIFGIRRIRRRKTPYVKVQTLTLMAIQCFPLFILPELLLPWAGRNGLFDGGVLGWMGQQFFPDGSYWRAYGFVLAWPLFVFNIFTDQPIWGWLVLGSLQTFVILPLIIRRWGKGVYCGWICSCGALAETMGDAHRHKMPHGPFWNRLNMVGQVVLAIAFVLLLLRIGGWVWPGSFMDAAFGKLFAALPYVNYKWTVDLIMAGVLGVGCYFWFSGRVWCRFACPLAALMHIYAKFTQFRIIPEKKKCISCNVCTSVCHQGIDVMNFANKGKPMNDVQCVRCSACVQSCPTGVLTFGRVDRQEQLISVDALRASLVK